MNKTLAILSIVTLLMIAPSFALSDYVGVVEQLKESWIIVIGTQFPDFLTGWASVEGSENEEEQPPPTLPPNNDDGQEICDDGIDNDVNGLTDCADTTVCCDDPICSSSSHCGSQPTGFGSCTNPNGVCEVWLGEHCGNCQDCACGSGQTCDSSNQCVSTTPAPACGDGVCDASEDCSTCVSDCACASSETCQSGVCVSTTPACGDGVCDATENCATCVSDCGCPSGEVCQSGTCNQPSPGGTPSCGDGVCSNSEDCSTCVSDCGCSSTETCQSGVCVAQTAGVTEICDDLIDNDNDGYVDCFDAECLTSPSCSFSNIFGTTYNNDPNANPFATNNNDGSATDTLTGSNNDLLGGSNDLGAHEEVLAAQLPNYDGAVVRANLERVKDKARIIAALVDRLAETQDATKRVELKLLATEYRTAASAIEKDLEFFTQMPVSHTGTHFQNIKRLTEQTRQKLATL